MAEPRWIDFYIAAAEIEGRFGGSQADAQARLRRACAGERVRSRLAPYELSGDTTILVEPIETWKRIAPSEWHKAQPDYAADGWMVLVSENDFRHWLNSGRNPALALSHDDASEVQLNERLKLCGPKAFPMVWRTKR
jgi:hypothetical protein